MLRGLGRHYTVFPAKNEVFRCPELHYDRSDFSRPGLKLKLALRCKVLAKQGLSKFFFATFNTPFDREFHVEQEYVFLEFFRGFPPFENSKKLQGSTKLSFSPFFNKVEIFQISFQLGLFKPPCSCSALKTELEK